MTTYDGSRITSVRMAQSRHTIDRQIIAIAFPAIVTNITVPLLGLVDVTIVGHMGSAAYIGAIAVGSMVFNMVYWLFAFLRMGTSGITAQAYGARQDTSRILTRALTIAIALGIILIAAQRLVMHLGLFIMAPEGSTRQLVITYLSICIWGAPAVLGLYALTGWFIGMQNTRLPMIISISQNIVNIACSVALVYGLGMKVEGVALGTLVAQWVGFIMAVAMQQRQKRNSKTIQRSDSGGSTISYLRFFTINRDLFLRTLFIVGVNVCFTAAGSRQGPTILAVNTLLFTLFTLYSYIMDGFAYAGEAICGKYYGAGNNILLRTTIRRLFVWGGALTAVYTLVYAFGGLPFLSLLTDDGSIVEAAAPYLPWAVAIPIAGCGAFLWDGVFIGITATRGMLISSCIAAVAFFLIWGSLATTIANHALWLALIIYLASRGIVQGLFYKLCR